MCTYSCRHSIYVVVIFAKWDALLICDKFGGNRLSHATEYANQQKRFQIVIEEYVFALYQVYKTIVVYKAVTCIHWSMAALIKK